MKIKDFQLELSNWPPKMAPPSGLVQWKRLNIVFTSDGTQSASWQRKRRRSATIRDDEWAPKEWTGDIWFCVMLTPENIVVLRACACSASKLLIFAISRRKTTLSCFSRSPTDFALDQSKQSTWMLVVRSLIEDQRGEPTKNRPQMRSAFCCV